MDTAAMKPMKAFVAAVFGIGIISIFSAEITNAARFESILQLSDLSTGLDKSHFPKGFVFGVSSSAYQYEGAAQEGGRKPSIWDKFSHFPANIADGEKGDLGNDQYHRYKEDVSLISSMGMKAYRLSISWSRFFPDGEINPEGLTYYNALIDALKSSGIEPYVTLFHYDLPLALETANGGWLNKTTVDAFAAYADASFHAFGDRVKRWITFNEPQLMSIKAYSEGVLAPGRCSGCYQGNSMTEPYIVGHNMLLAHAAAVKIYRQKYQVVQGGKIGITLNSYWFEPFSGSVRDIQAAERSLDFELGWFMDPVIFGDYPDVMRKLVKHRLPEFTDEQRQSLKNSIDFLGLNHYTTRYVQDFQGANQANTANGDPETLTLFERNGTEIGPRSASSWLYVVPWGFDKLLRYITTKYNSPEIVITENGMDEPNDPSLTLEQSLQDDSRILFYESYLNRVLQAIRDGVNVTGYFAWTLLDNYEWRSGYTVRFGLHFVDFSTMKRYPKKSALWFKQMLNCQKLQTFV